MTSPLNTLLAFLFLLLSTYPSSPVLFNFFIIEPRVAYIIFAMISILCLIPNCNTNLKKSGKWCKVLYYVLLYGFVVLLTKLLLHNISMAYRDLIALLLVYCMAMTGSLMLTKRLCIVNYILFTIIVMSAVVTLLSFGIDIFDFKEWYAPALGYLSPSNPAIKRVDNDFYLPFLLSVIPYDPADVSAQFALGLSYVRLPLIFIEWTYTWYYLAPTLIILMFNRHLQFRFLKIAFMFIALIMSLSVWGLFAIAASVLCVLVAKLRKCRNIVLILLCLFCILIFLNIDNILYLIGGNKYEEFLYYTGSIDVDSMLTLIGNSTEFQGEYITWGSLFISNQYGLLGMVFRLAIFICEVAGSTYVLFNRKSYSISVYGIAVSTLYLSMMGLKTAYFVPIYELAFLCLLFLLIDENDSKITAQYSRGVEKKSY